MKVYRVTQPGATTLVAWCASKLEAERLARKDDVWCLNAECVERFTYRPPSVEAVEVPTDKAGLLAFLNDCADTLKD